MRSVRLRTRALLFALGAGVMAGPGAAEQLFDPELAERPCDLLTADMVAVVAQVLPEDLNQRDLGGRCNYIWDEGRASISSITIHESADVALSRFEKAHPRMDQDDAGEEEMEFGARAGDPADVAAAQDRARGPVYSSVEGVGDLAAFETTRYETTIAGMLIPSYANKIDVVVGNMTYEVAFAFDHDPGEEEMHRVENEALAQLVADFLP